MTTITPDYAHVLQLLDQIQWTLTIGFTIMASVFIAFALSQRK
jgi:hypothetical protein